VSQREALCRKRHRVHFVRDDGERGVVAGGGGGARGGVGVGVGGDGADGRGGEGEAQQDGQVEPALVAFVAVVACVGLSMF